MLLSRVLLLIYTQQLDFLECKQHHVLNGSNRLVVIVVKMSSEPSTLH